MGTEPGMERSIMVGAAQLGPIARDESRQAVVARLLELMGEAHGRGCGLVVFPELALTSFFPRWWFDDADEIVSWFEPDMPSAATGPLFDEAARLGMGFCMGYAERVAEGGRVRHFNTSILVDQSGAIIGKYRKVHLPGHADNRPELPFQHLEKRYFDVGDLGFGTWRTMGGVMGMCICNDRRWPETYRVLALRGAEIVMLGYNTPAHIPWDPVYDNLGAFHNHLCMQAGAYQNGTWVVGVAKAGLEEGCDLIGGSAIIAPSGEIVAQCSTKDDELITARCDLELSARHKDAMLNFAAHRRIEHYGPITEQTGVTAPE
jgi:predicted amidohydrolase